MRSRSGANGQAWRSGQAWRVAAAAALAAAGLLGTSVQAATAPSAVAAVPVPVPASGPASLQVAVGAMPGRLAEAAAAVTAAGGTIGDELPIIDGFEATIPAAQLDTLRTLGAIRTVGEDTTVEFTAATDPRTTELPELNAHHLAAVGADRVHATGITGAGIGVALIDTGVSPMTDLAGRVVYGPDLSGEGTIVDTFGHGTVMAGLIAGSGADSAGAVTGIAPDAHVVAVKVAGQHGAVDVSTILQAMHWVSAYKNQFNIRVLNLSWGTPSTQSPIVDPLNYAVERLWQQGIVVVTSAGNGGPEAGSVRKPADDPLAITAGAYDTGANLDITDDTVPAWSSQGPTAAGVAKPDVVAPGRSIVATRSFGSTIEATNPSALRGSSYIVGSGTSQAAALTSGAAALLLSATPSLTPDQVKAALKTTAAPIRGVASAAQGSGRIDAVRAMKGRFGAPVQQTAVATGLGSLEASRGGVNYEADCDGDGVLELIEGEIDIFCEAWDGSKWTESAWDGSKWTGVNWNGTVKLGSAWTNLGDSLRGSAWTEALWDGSKWTGGEWTGSSWYGSAWTGSAWTGSKWTGSKWTGSKWTGSAWTDLLGTTRGSAWTVLPGARGSAWTDLNAAVRGSAWTAVWGE